jgi:hypothetical protein
MDDSPQPHLVDGDIVVRGVCEQAFLEIDERDGRAELGSQAVAQRLEVSLGHAPIVLRVGPRLQRMSIDARSPRNVLSRRWTPGHQ